MTWLVRGNVIVQVQTTTTIFIYNKDAWENLSSQVLD